MANNQSDDVNLGHQEGKAKRHGRRTVLRGLLAVPLVGTGTLAAPAGHPIMRHWREWRALEVESRRLLVKQRAIWAGLPDEVKHPKVLLLKSPTSGREYFASNIEEIDRHFTPPTGFQGTELEARKRRARRDAKVRELEAVRAAAEAELERSGYNACQFRVDEVCDQQIEPALEIEHATGAALAVIAAKADYAFSCLSRDGELGNCPVSGLSDIIRTLLPYIPTEMAVALAPLAGSKGTVEEAYLASSASVGRARS